MQIEKESEINQGSKRDWKSLTRSGKEMDWGCEVEGESSM